MRSVSAAALLLVAPSALAGGAHVAGSKHDFSATGPGPYRAVTERSPCVFCHAAHGAKPGPGLSSRPDAAAHHLPYESSTVKGRSGAPTGASRVCLSCHDGTIAVGRTTRGEIRMVGGDSRITSDRRSHLGTDLRGSHPISLRVVASEQLHEPRQGDTVRLDHDREVQCTSCHDPHDEWGDPTAGKFLVKPSERAALCLSCHAMPSQGAAPTHASSTRQYRDTASGAVRTLAAQSCNACHVQHGADKRGRLLRPEAPGDALCLECHSGATEKNVGGGLGKPSAHVTADRGDRHDAAEGPGAAGTRALPERSAGAPRHVACVDCHDPHASNATVALGSTLAGALAGVWGIDVDGQPVSPARHEYEICFKCHGDSANKPRPAGLAARRRSAQDDNLRRVFSPTAASSHPVAAPARYKSPTVRPAAGVGSTIRCTDCHASDQGPGAGGSGARGPHGSTYPALLERQYRTGDLLPEGPDAYALCYKCHDRDTLLSTRSSFPPHRAHVVEQATPCSVCHDPHGVSAEAGDELSNAHLVSFDLGVVHAGPSGVLRYDSSGVGHGSCVLTCHNVVHSSEPSSKKTYAY